jgi:hypothetical protein
MEVTAIREGGSESIVTWTSRIKKKECFMQPCRYRFALIILIESQTGQEMEECLSKKGRKSNTAKGEIRKKVATYSNVETTTKTCKQQNSSLLFAVVLNGILFCLVLKNKYLNFQSFKIRQTAKDVVNTDPYVSRLLLCCKDVESNPGPLPNTLVSDDNSSTGSNRSVKKGPTNKERAPGAGVAERSAAREADRISKFERTLIRDDWHFFSDFQI